MGLNCGLIGLPGCGKTTIFNAITAAGAASYNGSEMNRAVVQVPDLRIQPLVEMYHPPKVVPAALEIVDIPGLKAGSTAGEGHGTRLLGHIKDVDVLLCIVQYFEPESCNPVFDAETIDLEMMVADSQTLQNKITRLEKKAKNDKEIAGEVAACVKVKEALDDGMPARKQNLTEQELAAVYECHLLSLKPMLYIANMEEMVDERDDRIKALQTLAESEGTEMIIVCGRDEAEISQLDPDDQREFLNELGLKESSMERLIRAAYKKLNFINFFTAGEKEVHVWTCHKGDMAPAAAGNIHTDMEKGFIRMEVIRYEDLIEFGGEAAVAKAGKLRLEGKTYEVSDGDIVVVRFSPPK